MSRYPEMYQLWGGGAPFKKNPDGTLTDKSGTKYVPFCELVQNSFLALSFFPLDTHFLVFVYLKQVLHDG